MKADILKLIILEQKTKQLFTEDFSQWQSCFGVLFYLTAFIEDEEVRKGFDVINDSFPTIYRIDRIKNMSVLDERFHIPYSSRFEEGEFRKRIQFMYGGKIQKVRFRYKGPDIDSILDRLPTAHVLDEENGEYIVAAEVFGTGINMWIRSQGDYIEMIEEV